MAGEWEHLVEAENDRFMVLEIRKQVSFDEPTMLMLNGHGPFTEFEARYWAERWKNEQASAPASMAKVGFKVWPEYQVREVLARQLKKHRADGSPGLPAEEVDG